METESKKEDKKSQKAAEEGKDEQAQVHHEKSQVKQQLAETVETPTIEPETPKVKGVHTRDKWTAEVVDKKAFVEYCLKVDSLSYLDIKMSLLNKLGPTTAEGFFTVPGIKFICEKVPVFRNQ